MLHFNRSLVVVFLVLCHQSYGLHKQPQIVFVVIVFLFSSYNTVLDLLGQLAFSRMRFIIVSVFTPNAPFCAFFFSPSSFYHLHSWMFKKWDPFSFLYSLIVIGVQNLCKVLRREESPNWRRNLFFPFRVPYFEVFFFLLRCLRHTGTDSFLLIECPFPQKWDAHW